MRCSIGISVSRGRGARRRRRADPQRRRRDVHRQARRQGRLPPVRAGDARGRARAPRAARRPPARDRRPASSSCTTSRSCGCTTASVSGVEALLRWRHPERGLVAPDEFIPLAEEMGLIVPIGRWVLREGCRQAALMRRKLPDAPAADDERQPVGQAAPALRHRRPTCATRSRSPASSRRALTLEITESVMIADTDLAVERLRELKALGVRLAMDDFGTGYSSLSYLSRFPVDILKMDRSFLRPGASLAESEPRHRGGRPRQDAQPRGRRRGHRARGAVARAARRSAASSARASYFARPMDARRDARLPARTPPQCDPALADAA